MTSPVYLMPAIILARFPEEWGKMMTSPVYLIPAIILAILLVPFRFIMSPFWVYQERKKEAKEREAELNIKISEQEKYIDKIKTEAQKEKLKLENKIKELVTPKLELTFENSDKFIRWTPAMGLNGYHTSAGRQAYYVRIALKNLSSIVLDDIEVSLLNVQFLKNGKFEDTIYADQLILGGSRVISNFYINKIEYIDILSIDGENNKIRIESLNRSIVHKGLFEETGTYKLDIQASTRSGGIPAKISLKYERISNNNVFMEPSITII